MAAQPRPQVVREAKAPPLRGNLEVHLTLRSNAKLSVLDALTLPLDLQVLGEPKGPSFKVNVKRVGPKRELRHAC